MCETQTRVHSSRVMFTPSSELHNMELSSKENLIANTFFQCNCLNNCFKDATCLPSDLDCRTIYLFATRGLAIC